MNSNSKEKTYLRRAGQHQDEQIDELLNSNVVVIVFFLFFCIVLVIYEWVLWFIPSLRHPFYLTVVVLIWVVLGIVELFKVRKQIIKHRRGSLGEKVVADELEKIKRNGYMVIHDFQHERLGNIDHIVIGHKGVFVLETKYRTPKNEDDRIFFDGEDVYTINSSNQKNKITDNNGKSPCNQAAHASAELKEMLEIDFPKVKRVQPIVVFPFWEIKLKEFEKMPNVRVSNEKDIPKQLIGRDDYFNNAEVSAIYEFLATRNKL